METQIRTFEKNTITFTFDEEKMMVNATEMAKIYGKDVPDFMENSGTKKFIQSCLKNRNSGFLNIEKEEDLYTSIQKTGTWMHRVLALKFAAWLNPEFELWVYSTIDEILFGKYKELEKKIKENAERKAKIKKLETEIENDPLMDERIKDLIKLKKEDKTESRKPFSEIGKRVKATYEQLIINFDLQ